MTANRTGSLVVIDDFTANKSSRINSEVYSARFSLHVSINESFYGGIDECK